MTIYLYVKTHNKTGLKYLGKTTSTNPHKYKGSGTYWTSHIKKHGYDVTTTIIQECSSSDEIMNWGLYYSDLWNVVKSDLWANLKPESGEGGSVGGNLKKVETKTKISATMKGRPAHNKGKTQEHKKHKSRIDSPMSGLVQNKLKSILTRKGLKEMESIGKEFDADLHEGITSIPAPSPDLKGKILDELEKGYLLNDKVIRFAKVIIGA
jgi:hypothetical protein